MEVFEWFCSQQGDAETKASCQFWQAASSTDHPQGSLTDESTPPLPHKQPMHLPQTLEDMIQGQDMDQPFADNSGTTEVSCMTPQAAP